ncbi:MAG TPA: extracellular solute-binding protein [Methylomirabilota bacterium]|jgi:iron(III) transport system substrate-binding protein|nr:extracellular solute-binding protein [Methylomirabilota bacterium]
MNVRMVTLALVAALLALAGPAAAFEGEAQLHEAAKKDKEFTWYTAHFDSETAAAICNGFEKKYSVKCNYVRTTAQVAYQRLAQDMKGGLAIASVISSTDTSHHGKMKKDGWLQAYRPKNLSELIDSFKAFNDPDDQFLATAAGLVLINYNSSLVADKDAPKKWTDLLDPKWKGKISIGHPGFSGYVGTWVVQMKKLYGWDYFKKLELNKPRIGRSINDTVTMLNAKESWVGAGPSATTLISKDKGNPVAVAYPEDGAILMVSPSSILRNAPAPNTAKLFMEYLLSKDCNEIMVKFRQDSVNKFVKPLPGARSLADVKTIRPTYDEIDKGIPEVKELFRDTFGI